MTSVTTRVLLVEDNEDDYIITRDLLTQIRGGHYVLDWVTTFEAGMNSLGSGRHDVYLIDFRLGAESGLDLLRAMLDAGCRTPLILLTGQGDHEVDSAAMQAGAADYLVKGEITAEVLERALRHARDRAHVVDLRDALSEAQVAQDRLRASEQFALATLDALPEHIAILDHAGVILAVNAAWRRFGAVYGLGYPNALIGRNYVETCTKAGEAGDHMARRAAQGICDVLAGRAEAFSMEYPCHLPTQRRWFSLAVAPYADIGPGRVVVAHHDITSRMLAQEDVLRREHNFRLLFRDNPQPMWVYQVDTLRFLEINDAAAEHYGYSRAEFLAMRITDIVLPEDVAHVVESVSADLFALTAGEELRHRCKDGRIIDVALTVHGLEFDGVASRLVVAVDITLGKRAEEALLYERDFLQTLMDSAPDGIYIKDTEARFIRVNRAKARRLGANTPEEVAGKTDFDYAPPAAAHESYEDDLQVLTSGEPLINRLEDLFTHDQGIRAILSTKVPIVRDGKITGLVGISRDITDLRRAEEALHAGEERFRAQYRGFPLPTFTWRRLGDDWVFVDYNVAADLLTGSSLREYLGRQATELSAFTPDAPAILRRCASDGTTVCEESRRRFSTHPDPRDIVETWVLVAPDLIMQHIEDVTEQKRAEETLRHQALHDSLTGLPNRGLLHQCVAAAQAVGQDTDRSIALLLLDLDHFKEINDAFGHDLGNALLIQVAARLSGAVRAGDTVACLGGDDFALLLPGADAEAAARVAEELRAILVAPLSVNGQPLRMTASVGIATAPTCAAIGTTLLRQADIAMYAAKRGRLGHAFYQPSQDQHSPESLARIAELREAIEMSTLLLHYQPQVEMASGRVCGVEALVRWPHAVHGLIPPDEFIPLAEQTGLIAPLTNWVLAEAIRQCREWQRSGLSLGVSVNLSMWNLSDPALPERIAGLLRAEGLSPTSLRLELTESALMADTDRTIDVLLQLSALGLCLAVDDFGAGYSSLAYLKKLPVDELKIDRGFVRDMATDETDAAIVASTVALGHALALRVVAEGIENGATWDRLAAMGCDVAQGYHLARPLAPDNLAKWVLESQWTVA